MIKAGALYFSSVFAACAPPFSNSPPDLLYRLKASDLQLRFCTNETQASRETFVAKLGRLGFDISVSEVFSPAPAAIAVLKERGLRPHLLVCEGNNFFFIGKAFDINKHCQRQTLFIVYLKKFS